MNNSYRMKAERRACLSRASARAAARPPLELPPWGYGSGRLVLSTPSTTIYATRQMNRPRTHSVPPAKLTNSCCETGPAQLPVACSRPIAGKANLSNWSNTITHGHEEAELGAVVETKRADSVADKHAPNEISANIDSPTAAVTAAPTQDSCILQAAVDSVGDTRAVISSSMETWTTYDGTSTSPLVQSSASSPHSFVAPEPDSTSNMPLSPPHSATSCLHRLSPTALTMKFASLDKMFATALGNHMNDATDTVITPAFPSSDVTDGQKSITSTTQPTANEPLTTLTEDLAVPGLQTPLSSAGRSQEQNRVASPVNDSSVSGVNTPVTPNGGNDGEGAAPRRVASKTDSANSSARTSKANDEDKSNLIVGLVKVKSPHTGLMIDCPILETLYQNEIECEQTAVRQSSSHKVVLIKAVVPRWVWNGRGRFTPPSGKSTNRSNVDKRKSSVSVNTQTSETLLPVRRTISEHQSNLSSPTAFVDTHKYVPALEDDCQLMPSPKHKYVPALEDDCQLMPSPKLSACFARCKSVPRIPTECNPRSPVVEGREVWSPNSTSGVSSARAQNNSLIPAEISNVPLSSLLYSNVSMMLEKPEESELKQQPSVSVEYDSLMEDTIETLKLNLQFSSSGNNSDSESVTHGKTAAKRSSADCRILSSSSEDMASDRQLLSSCQGVPTLNWSCAATAATASSDAIDNIKTTSDYISETAVRMEPLPTAPRQKPESAGRRARTPPSQCRSPASNLAQRLSSSKRQSSPISSQRSDVKARMTPSGSSRSACPWRSATSKNVELGSWPERDLSGQYPHQYDYQQHCQSPSSQQHISSTTQYASRSESSLSDRSQSTSHDHYEVPPMNAPHSMSSTSSRSQHTAQSSLPLPDHVITSAGSDTCTTEQTVAVDMQHQQHHQHHRHHHLHHHDTNNVRSNTAGNVESATRHSRHNHRRSTPKHRTMEQKRATQEHYKMSTSAVKSSGDRHCKRSIGATRRGDVAQSSQSTGSMTVSQNARSPAAATKRQHSASVTRYMSRDARTNKHSPARDRTAERRASTSRRQYCSMEDNQRCRQVRSESHSASHRSDRQTTSSSGRAQRQGTRVINASMSRSADSMSRGRRCPPSIHANYSTFVGEQSKSTQPKRADNRQSHRYDDRQSLTTSYECRQPVVYCSPRSLRPFPPPISDRYPSSFDSSAAAVVGTSMNDESDKYVCVQQQNHSDVDDGQPSVIMDHVPPPPSHGRQERLYGPASTATDKRRSQRRSKPATVSSGGDRQRRKRLPTTPTVDGQGWCVDPHVSVRMAAPSVVERPAWRQY